MYKIINLEKTVWTKGLKKNGNIHGGKKWKKGRIIGDFFFLKEEIRDGKEEKMGWRVL